MLIQFHATIVIPDSHRFPMQQLYKQNRKEFIENWLQGALSTIVTGPVLPLPKRDKVEVIVNLME